MRIRCRGARPGRHEVDDPYGAVPRVTQSVSSTRVSAGVPAGRAGARPHGRESPVSRLVVVQEGGERGGRVEAGQAKPVDRPRGAHQSGRVQVSQYGVIFDFRHGPEISHRTGGGTTRGTVPELRVAGRPDALGDVIAHAQRVRDDRKGWVHRADRGHEAAIHHVEVVEVVGLAVHVKDRGGRLGPETRRPCLVGGGGGVECLVQVEAGRTSCPPCRACSACPGRSCGGG